MGNSTWGRAALAATLCLPLAAEAAQAPDTQGLVVCYPYAPGTVEAARPVMQRLGETLAARAGAAGRATFFDRRPAAREHVDRERPAFAILTLPLYLAWREPLGLEALASTERRGTAVERFHVVVPAGSPWRTLDDLRAAPPAGRRPVLWSSHFDDLRFASRVLLAGGLALAPDDAGAGDARGVATPQPLRALRRMAAGQPFEGVPVDAVVLEEPAWAEVQRLKTFQGALRSVFTSPTLPTPLAVALRGADADAAQRLRAALLGLREDAAGRELLTTLQLTGFEAVDAAALAAAAARYDEAAAPAGEGGR